MALGGEKAAVQRPFLRYAVEAGWTYLSPEETLDRRRGITSPVLDTILLQQLQRLNPGVIGHQRAEELARQIARVRPNIQGNFDAWAYLKALLSKIDPVKKVAIDPSVRLRYPEPCRPRQKRRG